MKIMKNFSKLWLVRIMLSVFLVSSGLAIIPVEYSSSTAVAQDFSLDDLEDEVDDASDSIKKIVKVVLMLVAIISGVFVVYNIMTNHPNAKNYGIGYVIGLVVISIIWGLFL